MQNSDLKRFRREVLTWFAQFRRELPWRLNKDPYRIWISEIMLQQTRVAAAIPYYKRFLEHFPNIAALAAAPEEEVLRSWSGLGYYSRARNLQKAAQQIVAQHDGVFPSGHADVLALSGIGNYTAAAILSIAHEQKHAVLDGNVARVLARLGAIHGDLRANGRWQRLQKMADDLLDPQDPGDWNQAMMELGATICTPRSPQCLLCPVNQWCEARKQGVVAGIPEKRNKRATEEITLAALVFVDAKGNSLLLAPPKTSKSKAHANVATLLSRLWHFPTIEVHQDAENELKAYVEKNFLHGKKIDSKLTQLKKVRHTVTYRKITILPFRADLAALPRRAHSRIIPLAEVSSVAISNLTRKVARSAVG
jgi:A/G-specific adenine glycosylase